MSAILSNDVRYAMKVTAGTVAALMLVLVFELPASVAVVLTVWVLLTTHRKQSLTDGMFRVLGPLVAAVVMFVALKLFASSALLVLVIATVLTYVGFAHYVSGVYSYAGMLMALITGIAACDAGVGPNVAMAFAVAWVGCAFLGVVLVHVLTWSLWPDLSPGFARDQLRYKRIFPLPPEQAAITLRCTIAVMATVLLALVSDLPAAYMAVVAAGIVAIAPPTSGGPLRKAFYRMLGIMIGGAYGIVMLIILAHLPFLGMLFVLIAAAYFSLAYAFLRNEKYSYAISQGGIVLTMILLGSSTSVGTLTDAIERLQGLFWGGLVAVMTIDLMPPLTVAAGDAILNPRPISGARS